MDTVADMIRGLPKTYLPQNNLGVRRFAVLSGITRPRMQRLFDGKTTPTIGDVNKISNAMRLIDDKRKRQQERETKQPENAPTVVAAQHE